VNAPICFNATSESDTSFGYRNRIHESPCERGLRGQVASLHESVPRKPRVMTRRILARSAQDRNFNRNMITGIIISNTYKVIVPVYQTSIVFQV